MRLVTAVLARNEAAPDRYLKRVLERCAEFSDAILVLDDGSTDDTAQVARDCGAVVETRSGDGFWRPGGGETSARRELWERAAALAGDGWVLVCDADMLLVGDPRPLTLSWDAASWAWPLCDLWNSEDAFRVDGAWKFGPLTPRPWLFRPRFAEFAQTPFDFAPLWPESCIHSGHAPANWHEHHPTFVAPPDMYWKHLSYVKPEHRARKRAQYAAVADTLSPFQRAHAESI